MRLNVIPKTTAWYDLRSRSVTGTDISVIMSNSPWKTVGELYDQKKGVLDPDSINAAMQRGIDLEHQARSYFFETTGVFVIPCVVVCDKNDRFMASLDGIDDYNTCVLEIKCPGKKTIDLAEKGIIPQYYQDQIQWQMLCAGVSAGYYLCYDGHKGNIIKVERDQEYIEEMIEKANEFIKLLDYQNKEII